MFLTVVLEGNIWGPLPLDENKEVPKITSIKKKTEWLSEEERAKVLGKKETVIKHYGFYDPYRGIGKKLVKIEVIKPKTFKFIYPKTIENIIIYAPGFWFKKDRHFSVYKNEKYKASFLREKDALEYALKIKENVYSL